MFIVFNFFMEFLKMFTFILSRKNDLPTACNNKYLNAMLVMEYIENHTNYSIFKQVKIDLQVQDLIAKGKKVTDIIRYMVAMSDDGIGEYNENCITVFITE